MWRDRSPARPPGRLALLKDDLEALGRRLRGAIARVVADAAARAVEAAVAALLGRAPPARRAEADDDAAEGGLFEEQAEHQIEDEEGPLLQHPRGAAEPARPAGWGAALRSGAQAGLWWLRKQGRRRPVLGAAVAAVAAGCVAYAAGPALAAGACLLASAAELLLTADSAGELLARLAAALW
jgi:hypothetical protein